MNRPNFFVFENNSKGIVLALPFEAYDLKRYRERMVATNLVRQLEIDIDKYAGWAFT